jgi:hypothetical protein
MVASNGCFMLECKASNMDALALGSTSVNTI